MKNHLRYLFGIVFCILLIPFLAMQLTDEVQWDVLDFVVGAVILFLAGGLILFLSKSIASKRKRVFLLIAIILVTILVWAELAVGVFGSPIAGS